MLNKIVPLFINVNIRRVVTYEKKFVFSEKDHTYIQLSFCAIKNRSFLFLSTPNDNDGYPESIV